MQFRISVSRQIPERGWARRIEILTVFLKKKKATSADANDGLLENEHCSIFCFRCWLDDWLEADIRVLAYFHSSESKEHEPDC